MLGSIKRAFEDDRDNYKFVRENFKKELDQLFTDELDEWKEHHQSALAYIILSD